MKHYFLSRHLAESNTNVYCAYAPCTKILNYDSYNIDMQSIIHAFIPFLFEKCVTNLMNNLLKEDLHQSS